MRHTNEIWNVYICLFNIKGHILSFIKHICVSLNFIDVFICHFKKKVVFICRIKKIMCLYVI